MPLRWQVVSKRWRRRTAKLPSTLNFFMLSILFHFNNNNNNNYTSLQRHISSLASRADDRGPGKKLNNINIANIKQK